MVFVLYKVNHSDNKFCLSGVFENENDAYNEKKLLIQDKMPEELEQESFSIEEIHYWKHESYNKKDPPFRYLEEDNDINESDISIPSNNIRIKKAPLKMEIVKSYTKYSDTIYILSYSIVYLTGIILYIYL